ncbi:capsular polysaccharide biosynthesis protein [Paragemmobacter straminiformis]|uniref:Capsular polysaccharide biosynthesis protein n=1 Tax=Paragemmobacter straminiformis TaxID=2045119 RepID=A0A842ICU6_9RHOB|nr:capsular polysaccharide biosynthesis protein [Gemmobacter straminiformis]MBC2837127.1 capsular polysaccharide biosynthesis protein [Gemmobacter straminiformis]
MHRHSDTAAEGPPRRLFYLNGGFLNPRLRRILALSGHSLHLGLPQAGDGLVAWGRSPTAGRAERMATRRNLPLVRVEDAFLRSLRPGRQGDAPLGLLIDPLGVHFDASAPSLIEHLAITHPLDDTTLLARARDGIARLQTLDLSKYNLHDPALAPPAPGYVLVIDQTRGDASIAHSGASPATFAEMLAQAAADHPTARIVVKTHPETALGLRAGHYSAATLPPNATLLSDPVSPWALLNGAIAVYAVSSQLGFEAILAGHRPHVFGQPFYAGWGLTHDRQPIPRRKRSLTRAQLFAVAMILAPTWYDPCRDRLCSFEEAVDQLEAETRAFRQDRAGYVALGMRLWKRPRLAQVFGREKSLIFARSSETAITAARATRRPLLVWAGKEPALPPDLASFRCEDGFLRSRGLGADLVPPLSLVTDDLGIYYDPTRESRLERLIATPFPAGAEARADRLLSRIIGAGLSKYNLGQAAPDLPQGHRILVPGQVEDDASIRLGAAEVRTNRALLQAVRAANPTAVIVYKPHPDVEAGLREGAIPEAELARLADAVARHTDPVALLDLCAEVWTMTSLLGFEALLRGKPVTTLGAPFYAGWGLTRDLGPVPDRRLRLPDGSRRPPVPLLRLVHAALIAYPRYYDPVTRRPCPPEVALDRLASGDIPAPTPLNRLLAKAQGALAGQAWLWR